MADSPVLRLTGISKAYVGTNALTDITLEVEAGRVLCLLGDNGAGKSTLIKIISGVHAPSSGTLEVNGSPVRFASPRDASTHGIATVHQFGGTFPLMGVGRSFFVGAEPTKSWGPFKRFDKATAGERQALAIARAVFFGANVLILDEPTAALGVKEATHVLRLIMQARARGVAVVFVTHNVLHAMMVGDHFAVLIRGEKADDFRKGERSREQITDLMAGGEAMADLEAELARMHADA